MAKGCRGEGGRGSDVSKYIFWRPSKISSDFFIAIVFYSPCYYKTPKNATKTRENKSRKQK
jgi:hypothetical protein